MNIKMLSRYAINLVIGLSVAMLFAYLFSLLGTIHGKAIPESFFSQGQPTIIALLDSEFFMGLIFFITLSIFVYLGWLLWQLHEVAVHKAKQAGNPQVQLIFALSLCGLFIHKAWWVVAIIIAFTSWSSIGVWLKDVIHNKPVDQKGDEQ